MNSFIKVSNILPRIPDVRFPKPISFTMNKGDVWTFYGPNGSGKTLLSEIICGRYGLSSGSIDYTFLEEAGNGLSGGEKQRIALARAFLKKNEFYILDESTSNLDFATENIIFDMIYNKFRKKSMLIIAHRLATVKNCDEIIVMNQGEIVERGNHEELLARKGEYYKLWEMQQGNFVVKEEEKKEDKVEITFDEDEMSYT